MNEFSIFKDLISKSAKKNGKDKTLTLGHLENLLNMASRIAEKEQGKTRASFKRCI